MSSYVVTGASRGIGLEFLRQLSANPSNTVVGIVRDKLRTEENLPSELKTRGNLHLLQADITDYGALKQSATDVAKITGGSLDYLIANAGLVTKYDPFDPIGVLGSDPKGLEEELLECFKINVIGQIHLFNLFIPLILKGKAKKVVAMSSSHADLDSINRFQIATSSVYAISKAGLNTAVAKFNAQYGKDGVLFISICPGMVEVGHYNDATPQQLGKLGELLGKFGDYAPDFQGPSSPESAVKDVISVYEKASVENGDGGTYVSHYGNKQWL